MTTASVRPAAVSRQVPWVPVLLVLGCAGLAGLAPLWLLLLSPILLGVPHVAADLRYLVLEPPRPLARGLLFAVGGCLLAMTLLRLGALLGGPAWLRAELGMGLLAVGLAVAWSARWGWLIPLGALGAGALAWPGEAALLVGHAHNAVAVALWVAWARGPLRWWVPALVLAVLGVLASGALDGWLLAICAEDAAGLSLSGMVRSLAPDLPGAWGLRAVVAFAFMQAVHYAAWLVAIPMARHGHPLVGWREALGSVGVAAVVLGTTCLLYTSDAADE